MPQTSFPDPFSGQIDHSWKESHPASASFVNELYITVVKAGQQANLRSVDAMLQSLWPPRDRAIRSAYLDGALKQLNNATQAMLGVLQPFGARLLTVAERNGIYYGEHIEFLEKLINLEERPMPVPTRDLSQVLTSGDITFGFNSMEVRTAEGHRRFATIMTVKEYKESTLAGIDKFLDIPCELIISQCFDFVGAETAREAYEQQARYLSISGDKEMAAWMEIDRLMADSTSTQKAFGEQQTTIFLIAPSIRQLEQNVRLTQKAIARIGMVAVREDLRFEECYWAQLPGNFPFISRKHSVDTQHLAGFANLQNRPMGNASGSPWGPPVALFTTMQDTPYFFNFQRDNLLHSIVIGRPRTGRTSFAHFLIAQARRIPNLRIWYVDCHNRAGTFINSMNGTYATPGTLHLRLNPFRMTDNPANREFLALWIASLLDPSGGQVNSSTLGFFKSLVAEVMALPASERRLSSLLPSARNADPLLAQRLARFCAGGEFGELFDMPDDQFTLGALSGWNIAPWCATADTRVPLAAYLLHRFTTALDGKPTLLVLDEGFALLNNPLFAARAGQWCDYMATKNCSAMLLAESPEQAGSAPFAATVAARAATIFAMPDPDPAAEYAMGFQFTESDFGAIAHADLNTHQVFMKRGDGAFMLKMDLSHLGTALPILSGKTAIVAPAENKSAADVLADLMGYGSPAEASA